MSVRLGQHRLRGHAALHSLPRSRKDSGHLGSWYYNKKLLLPTLKVPSSFSQYVSQDGGPHICTLLIVPGLHHIPLYLLFFQVIYMSLALSTVQPRFLQADPNLALSGANGNLSTDSTDSGSLSPEPTNICKIWRLSSTDSDWTSATQAHLNS